MWVIRVGDVEVLSDDFLIEDLEAVEKTSGVPWSIANPLREIKVARAFLAVAMVRQGKSDREVEAELRTLTLRTLKNTFDYRADEDEDTTEDDADPLPPSPLRTSRKSSRGRPVKGGSRPLHDVSESETSSSSSESSPVSPESSPESANG
jgi:hypothetical protein